MKKIFNLLIVAVFVLSMSFVAAAGDHEVTFAEAEEIIKEKIDCNELSNEQLEILGDYYMEQMHPGEAHEFMDDMMGGEGSESLRQAHINMGNAFYCGEHDAMSGNMMDIMMYRGNMMGTGGMMSNENIMGDGFWSSGTNYYRTGIFNWIFMCLILVALILLIVFLIKRIQEK